MGQDVHLDQIAKETDGFSGSDLKRMSKVSSGVWCINKMSQIYVSARHFQPSRIPSTFLGVIYHLYLRPLCLLDLNNDHERLYLVPAPAPAPVVVVVVVDLGMKFWSWRLEKAEAVEVEVGKK